MGKKQNFLNSIKGWSQKLLKLKTLRDKFSKKSKSSEASSGQTVTSVGKKALKKIRKKASKQSEGNLSWDGFVASIFGVSARPRIHKFFKLALLVCLFFSLGKILAIYLTPQTFTAQNIKGKKGKKGSKARRTKTARPVFNPTQLNQNKKVITSSQVDIIARSDIFNTGFEPVQNEEEQPKVNQALICLEGDDKSNLPLKLLSTIVLQDSIKSVASVQVRGKEFINIREGEKIDDLAEVGKINRMGIVIKNLDTGACELVANEEDPKASKPSRPINVVSAKKGKKLMTQVKNDRIESDGKNFKIKKSLRDDMLKDITKILTQAKAVQMSNPDGSLCFKMTQVVPGSIYSLLDIQDNDIICQINGKKITDLTDLMNMFGQIQNIDNFKLGLKRNGETQNKSYQFVQ